MNENLTEDWAKCCWGTLSFGRYLLVWDTYKCHLTTGVKDVVSKVTRTDVTIVPGGLTSLVQPAYVCWNKPFKEKYKEMYGEWVATWQKSYTHAGNIQAPSKFQCLKKAWAAVPIEVIVKSFRCCGITVKVDGSEDKEIHCIKDSSIAADAFTEISQSTAALLSSDADGSDDPFADATESDDDGLEQNEIVIDAEEDADLEATEDQETSDNEY